MEKKISFVILTKPQKESYTGKIKIRVVFSQNRKKWTLVFGYTYVIDFSKKKN